MHNFKSPILSGKYLYSVSGAIRHSKFGCLPTSKAKFVLWCEASDGPRPQRRMTAWSSTVQNQWNCKRGANGCMCPANIIKQHDGQSWRLKTFCSIKSWLLVHFVRIFRTESCVALASNSATSKARNACSPQQPSLRLILAHFCGAFSKKDKFKKSNR